MNAATDIQGVPSTPLHPLFKLAANTKPFLKVGARGFAGTGKTWTLFLIALELLERLRQVEPATPNRITIFDTEKAAGFLRPLAEEAGVELYVVESRALLDWEATVKECERGFCSVLITDSITHIYQGFLTAYQTQKNRKFLQFDDWGQIKPEWAKRFSEPFVRSRVHILFAGRAGYEYEQVEVDKPGGGTKKEIQKSGVKMKADADTAFEPDIVLHMERVEEILEDADDKKVWRECTVIKDRSGLLDGKTLRNPTGADFRPLIDRLINGPKDLVVRREGDDRRIFDDNGESQYVAKRNRTIAIENLQGIIAELYPSQSSDDKKARLAVMVEFFDTRSWTEVEMAPLDKLRHAVSVLKDRANPTTGTLTDVSSAPDSPAGGKDAAPVVVQKVVRPTNDIEREQMRRELGDIVGGAEDPVASLSRLAGRPTTTVHDLDDDTLASALNAGREG